MTHSTENYKSAFSLRSWIENQLLLLNQLTATKKSKSHLSSSDPFDQEITIQQIAIQLKKRILRCVQQESNNELTLSKIGARLMQNNINKQNHLQLLQKNQIFTKAAGQISAFLFKIAYSHPAIVIYPKYTVQENIIAFYELSKHIYHSGAIFSSKECKAAFNQEIMELLFTQKIVLYKDIYYRLEQSELFRNFIEEIFLLIRLRIKHFFHVFFGCQNSTQENLCISHIKCFIEKYQMNDSSHHYPQITSGNIMINMSFANHKKNTQNLQQSNCPLVKSLSSQKSSNYFNETQNQQFLNSISIDYIIICFIYLSYRLTNNFSHVRLAKLTQIYYKQLLKYSFSKPSNRWRQKQMNIMQFYNDYYLKFYFNNKIQKINKYQIKVDESTAHRLMASLVQSNETILDNFVSSFQG